MKWYVDLLASTSILVLTIVDCFSHSLNIFSTCKQIKLERNAINIVLQHFGGHKENIY